MAFQSDFDHDNEAMSDINMTPLVDVMLVLLIIFMITMPVLTQQVTLNLPETTETPPAPDEKPVSLTLNSEGQLYWGEELLEDMELQSRLTEMSLQQPNLAVQLQADKNVRYERVAQIIARTQSAGIREFGLVTEVQ